MLRSIPMRSKTEPDALTGMINHERMPVLLSGEDQFESGFPVRRKTRLRSLAALIPVQCRLSKAARKKKTCWRDRPLLTIYGYFDEDWGRTSIRRAA